MRDIELRISECEFDIPLLALGLEEGGPNRLGI